MTGNKDGAVGTMMTIIETYRNLARGQKILLFLFIAALPVSLMIILISVNSGSERQEYSPKDDLSLKTSFRIGACDKRSQAEAFTNSVLDHSGNNFEQETLMAVLHEKARRDNPEKSLEILRNLGEPGSYRIEGVFFNPSFQNIIHVKCGGKKGGKLLFCIIYSPENKTYAIMDVSEYE